MLVLIEQDSYMEIGMEEFFDPPNPPGIGMEVHAWCKPTQNALINGAKNTRFSPYTWTPWIHTSMFQTNQIALLQIE